LPFDALIRCAWLEAGTYRMAALLFFLLQSCQFAVGRLRSLMGQGSEALPVIDALGCLRSLRARLALDGVSWVQGG
jgi:hypothetical protein